MFPSDDILLARGKYATLSHERREQIVRVQKTCTTIINQAGAALRDCQANPPTNESSLDTLQRCLESLKQAREKLIELCTELSTLKPIAWNDDLEKE